MPDLQITDATLKGVQAARKEAALKSSDPRSLTLEKRKAFAYGNQAGDKLEYWAGLKPGTDATPEEQDEFKRRIVIADALSPALNTFTSHILGDDPDWVLTRPDSEDELDEDTEEVKALTLWHKEASLHERLKKADYDMRWGGASYLRMFIPEELSEIDPSLTSRGSKDLTQALRLAHLQALDATEAGVYRTPTGLLMAYWYAYGKQVGDKMVTHVEVHTRQAVALYVEENGELKLAPPQADLPNPYPNPVADPADPLTFHSLMCEVRRGEGPQIQFSDVDLQGSTSVAASNIRKNNDLFGHRQYYTVNAAPPLDRETGEETFYQFGPKRVLDIQADYARDAEGNPVQDANGKPTLTPVSVGTFDPVDSRSAREDAEWYKRALYDRHNLLWRLAEGQVSGESKRESRSAFDRSLPDEAGPITGALEWAIGTAYRFAQYIGGSDTPESLNVDARLFLRVAPVDLETWKSALEAFRNGEIDLMTLAENNPFGVDPAMFVRRVRASWWENPHLALAMQEKGISAPVVMRVLENAMRQDTPPDGLTPPVSSQDVTDAQELASLGLQPPEPQGGNSGNLPNV